MRSAPHGGVAESSNISGANEFWEPSREPTCSGARRRQPQTATEAAGELHAGPRSATCGDGRSVHGMQEVWGSNPIAPPQLKERIRILFREFRVLGSALGSSAVTGQPFSAAFGALLVGAGTALSCCGLAFAAPAPGPARGRRIAGGVSGRAMWRAAWRGCGPGGARPALEHAVAAAQVLARGSAPLSRGGIACAGSAPRICA